MNRYKLIATATSIGFYFTILMAILYYFGYHFRDKKVVNFVDKNGSAIKVTLASSAASKAQIRKKTPKKIIKKEHKKIIKKTPKPKKITKPKKETKKEPKKAPPKKVIKKPKKIVKKKLQKATQKPHQKPKKTIDAKKLFSSINKSSLKTDKHSKSLKKEQKAKGISNEYLAKIQKALLNWPAQANFAGEEIDVVLKIYPSGHFEYKVKKLSKNREFNKELFAYLKQLKKIGFGPHSGNRAYEIEVRFIAHD